MTAMDFSIFGPYEPLVVGFLLSVLVVLVRWIYLDAVARGDALALVWAGSIALTFLSSAVLYPPAVVLGTVLLLSYRATHTGPVRRRRTDATRTKA